MGSRKTSSVAALLALSAASVIAGPAFAVDPTPLPAPSVVYQDPPPYNWTAFYVGVKGGLAGRQFVYPYEIFIPDDVEGPFEAEGFLSLKASGFLGGAQAGFDFQPGRFVVGAVADIVWSEHAGQFAFNISRNTPPDPTVDDITLDVEVGTRLNWYGTLRARVGVVGGDGDRFLMYATGGLAYGVISPFVHISRVVEGDDDFQAILDGPIFDFGWVVGGGTEFQINRRLSFQTEYLFMNFGAIRLADAVGSGGQFFPPGSTFTFDVVTRVHVITAGFNLRLGGND